MLQFDYLLFINVAQASIISQIFVSFETIERGCLLQHLLNVKRETVKILVAKFSEAGIKHSFRA